MTTLSLSRLHWGRPSADKKALMVHGLGLLGSHLLAGHGEHWPSKAGQQQPLTSEATVHRLGPAPMPSLTSPPT